MIKVSLGNDLANEMRKRYDLETNNMQKFRIKLANYWHGPKRKTLVYNVKKAHITFPYKEMVSVKLLIERRKKCQNVIKN